MSQENQATISYSKDQLRVEALGHAVRHRLKDETSDDVVKAAEKYFAFLTKDNTAE